MNNTTILLGFLVIFLIYQIAEANGQDLLKLPYKPYSTFVLFILVIPSAYLVACWQGSNGLTSYGMGFHNGWWQNYFFGVGLGVVIQATLEYIGIKLGIRQVANLRFPPWTLFTSLLWILFANFPAAAAEDLITRGYLLRFIHTSPLAVFMICSTLLYTFNHILRLLTRPITDWYYLPFLGLTLAYALYQTGSLWYVIGLHQAGNVIYYLMHQLMDITNTTDIRKRITFGVVSELIMLVIVILLSPLTNINLSLNAYK